MVNFPASLDTLANPTGVQVQGSTTPTHSGHHANANDILEAIEAKLGIGASIAAANQVLRGTGAGATAFGQVQTADIAALAVTEARVANAVAIGASTASGSHVTITDMDTGSFTTYGGPLLAILSIVVQHTTANQYIFVALKLDSGGSTGETNLQPTTLGPLAGTITALFTGVSAGSHRVQATWLTQSATASSPSTQRQLIVVEFRR